MATHTKQHNSGVKGLIIRIKWSYMLQPSGPFNARLNIVHSDNFVFQVRQKCTLHNQELNS